MNELDVLQSIKDLQMILGRPINRLDIEERLNISPDELSDAIRALSEKNLLTESDEFVEIVIKYSVEVCEGIKCKSVTRERRNLIKPLIPIER